MKIYELTLGLIQILIFITCCLFIYFGYKPSVVFIISIFGNLIMWLIRLMIVSKLINFNFLIFLKEILLFIIKITTISISLVLMFQNYLDIGYLNPPLIIFASFIVNIVIAVLFFRKIFLFKITT